MNTEIKRVAPEEVQRIADHINEQWLRNGVRVFPYFCEADDFSGDHWRLNLSTAHKEAARLFPEKADGHTYHIFACAIEDAYEAGRTEGLKVALKRLSENLAGIIRVNFDD